MTRPFTTEQGKLLRDLFAAGCVLVGDEIQARFGLRSPIYIDMRENLYAHPELLWRVGGEFARKICELAREDAAGGQVAAQTVVGIPDTATPLALATALHAWQNHTRPEITFALLRKEGKRYPGREGSFWIGPRAAAASSASATPFGEAPRAAEAEEREFNLIDDVVASGLTKRAAIEKLRAEGIAVRRIVVLFDRQQGDGLREEGFRLHAIFQLKDVVDFYGAESLITPTDHYRIQKFLATHRFDRTLAK